MFRLAAGPRHAPGSPLVRRRGPETVEAEARAAWPPGRGVTLLPNGWRIAPPAPSAVGDLPLAMAESPDGRTLVVSNNGYSKPSSPWSTSSLTRPARRCRWRTPGSASPGIRTASGSTPPAAAPAPCTSSRWTARGWSRGPSIPLEQASSTRASWAASPSARTARRLYAVHALGQAPLGRGPRAPAQVDKDGRAAGRGLHDACVSPDGKTLFVSLWGGAKVLLFDAATLAPRGRDRGRRAPERHGRSRRTARGCSWPAPTPTRSGWSTSPRARRRSRSRSPSIPARAAGQHAQRASALSPDGSTLLVANADNNTVAVVDVSPPGRERVAGFIPTGWYPTAVQFSRDGKRIFVLSGKGLTSTAEPARPPAGRRRGAEGQYVGAMLQGSLSVARRCRTTQALAALHADGLPRDALHGGGAGSPRPARPRARRSPPASATPSPIKHVFYVIQENRTYDQVLGDMTEGNGDRTSASSARRSRRTPTPWRASSCCSTTSTSTARSATTATRGRPAPTPPTSSRRSGR